MDFRIKCALQHAFSAFPAGHKLNYFFQRYISRSLPVSDAEFLQKIDEARDHYNNFLRFNRLNSAQNRFYEFGVGWVLLVP